MGTSLFRKALSVSQVWKRGGGLCALFGMLLLGATPALAGVGLGVTPTFPASAKLGIPTQTVSLRIAWQNTSPDDLDDDLVSGIVVTPSCGEFPPGSECPSTPTDFRDPGVFTLASSSVTG